MSGSTSNNNVIGYGSDSIVLDMSEDQAVGVDAQFTVNVDGQQIGGLQSVSASHAAGQSEQFTFQGDFGQGQHNVTVTFANNFIYPGATADRNLYVNGVKYDGQTVSSSTTPIYQSPFFPPNSTTGNNYGNAIFSVNDTTSIPAGATPQGTTTPGPVSVGSGSDTLILNMAEDPYQGDAQFTVSVDGKQIGGTQTTTAVVEEGQSQEFDVHGNFGGGNHTVTVNYLNDAIGGYYPAGTPGLPPGQWAIDTTDRNLYVMGMTLNGGSPASGAPWELSSSGSASFSVSSGSNPSAGSSGQFASDGAAPTSNNAAITSASLASGSMSFVTPSSTAVSASTPAATMTATDTTPAITTAASGTTASTQDFTVPSTPTATPTTTNTGAGGGSWHNWASQQTSGGGGVVHHGHG